MLCAFVFLFGAIWSTWIDVNLDRGLMHISSGAEWSGASGTLLSHFVARAVEIPRLTKTEAICSGASVADGN